MVRLLLFVLATSAFSCPFAQSLSTLVKLRIEGAQRTIFEGPVLTNGHNVTTVSGGNHHCDGTNNNQNPTPGPTCTSALDDAARVQGFSWDGSFFTEFDDYLVDAIGGERSTSSLFCRSLASQS